MANLTPDPIWQDVYQIEITDRVLGGEGGISNVQAQALLNQNLYARKHGGALPYLPGLTYDKGDRIKLLSGGLVVSEIDGNSSDPNTDMTGWVLANAASQIFDSSGKNQEEINISFKKRDLDLDDFKTPSISDVDAIESMIRYASDNGINKCGASRPMVFDRRLQLTQDETEWLNNIEFDTKGHDIHYTGAGADSLYIGVIEIKGVLTTTTTTVVGDHAEYTSDLTVASTAGFSVGDYILIRSAATTKPDIYLNHVVKIESINGNTFGTDTLRRLAASPSVAPVNVTKVNTVNNFKLLGNSKITADGQTARSNGIGGVVMTYASDSQVVVKSEGLWFKTISANNCHRSTIVGVNKFAVAKGGGEGYCVQLQYSTHCIAKGTGEYLRHTTDCTASWHCTYVDSSDYYASSGSFIHHCASEYNINYFNCHSYGSQTNAFALGTVSGTFSDFSDKIELINCSGLMSKAAAIAFANKGKGLTVRGGTYDPDGSVAAYSITSSNNDTNIYNAYLPKGVQCSTSADMYTGGVFKIHYSDIAAGGNTRALNISANRHIELFGGTLSGRWTLADAVTVEMTDTNLIYPASAQLLQLTGTGHKIMQVGGKQTYPVGATVAQTLSVAEYIAMNVKLVSNGLSHVTSNSSAQTTYTDMFGVGAISITGGTNIVLNDNKYTANGSNIAMNVTGVTGQVEAKNNNLKGSATNTLNIHTSCVLSRSNISGNTLSGRLVVPEASFVSGIVKNNIVATGSTVPTASSTKLVSDNLLI